MAVIAAYRRLSVCERENMSISYYNYFCYYNNNNYYYYY